MIILPYTTAHNSQMPGITPVADARTTSGGAAASLTGPVFATAAGQIAVIQTLMFSALSGVATERILRFSVVRQGGGLPDTEVVGFRSLAAAPLVSLGTAVASSMFSYMLSGLDLFMPNGTVLTFVCEKDAAVGTITVVTSVAGMAAPRGNT